MNKNTAMRQQTKQIAPVNSQEIDCQKCMFSQIGDSGYAECLLETTRLHWSMPTAKIYCSDPAAKKFVAKFHSKYATSKKN